MNTWKPKRPTCSQKNIIIQQCSKIFFVCLLFKRFKLLNFAVKCSAWEWGYFFQIFRICSCSNVQDTFLYNRRHFTVNFHAYHIFYISNVLETQMHPFSRMTWLDSLVCVAYLHHHQSAFRQGTEANTKPKWIFLVQAFFRCCWTNSQKHAEFLCLSLRLFLQNGPHPTLIRCG